MRKLPKEELYDLYVKQFFTYQDLANHFSCSTETIRLNIEFYNIPKSEKGNNFVRRMKMTQKQLRSYLVHLYWEKKMSIHQIAEYLDASQLTIWTYMNKLGIQRRSQK